MKIRTGFVSNSSSSSFVLPKRYISEAQLEDLMNFTAGPVGPYHDTWEIYVEDNDVKGYTCMDNNCSDEGGLKDWMQKNRFPMDLIEWKD